jgi:hypothetical protein
MIGLDTNVIADTRAIGAKSGGVRTESWAA